MDLAKQFFPMSIVSFEIRRASLNETAVFL